MYGKHFESMYDGSMYGAGVAVFAVWGYVISHAREAVVELNPQMLAHTLGGKEEEIIAAIKKLQSPDPRSRHKEYEGRRLVKEGEYQYRVPSWEYYQTIKTAEALREYNRLAKRRSREKRNTRSGPLAGESAAVSAMARGDDKMADYYAAERVNEKPVSVNKPLTGTNNSAGVSKTAGVDDDEQPGFAPLE